MRTSRECNKRGADRSESGEFPITRRKSVPVGQVWLFEDIPDVPAKRVYESLRDEDTGIAPDQNFTSLLRDLTCHSEAIVTGKANASRSHLSTSKSAIYSDYDFQIGGVLKSGSPSKLEPALHIVVTRPGGKLPVSGGSVQYVNQMFLPLRPDTTYLLFLSQIPATGAFQPASLGTNGQVFSSLEMQPFGSQWRIYRAAYIQRDFPEFADATLRSIIATAIMGCK